MGKKNDSCKECEKIKKDFETLKKDHDLINNQLRLLQSDFDNYKKRAFKEKNDLSDFSKMEVLSEILPELEVFSKACELSSETGFKGIQKNIMKSLEKMGLKEIKSIGEKFDINLHEAMVCVNDKSKEDGIIIDEAEKGYLFNGKLLRPAKVIVNKK